ncbi:MAG: 2-isopropylmalate synthase [Candidatus Geothermarchaeales archaeon]
MERITIFDTTLRDGEQSPGASLNVEEKLRVAKQLAKLGVDVIEAGFPITSPDDFKAVKLISRTVRGPVIAGLARTVEKDIDRAYEAVRYAEKPRIHVFLATSDIHMKYKLRKGEEDVLKLAGEAVKYAKRLVDDVEFSPEDATRTKPEFLYRVVERAIDEGATTVNIPDTVGYAQPDEFSRLIGGIFENVPSVEDVTLSVHCHNDLGLAVANSLAALRSGARQVECTVNGIGERAGNASLEEIVMSIATRRDFYQLETGVNTKEIYKTSRLVSSLTGIPTQPNKAIVGANAFAHEAGVHQDGVLKERSTYEIMTPQSIGLSSSRLVLGKTSGRHAFKDRLSKLGYELTEKQLEKAFNRFKELADKKKEIFDEDLETIVEEEIFTIPETFHLEHTHILGGSLTTPTATVVMTSEGITKQGIAHGNGPVDAAYRAIDKVTGVRCRLLDYSLKAVTRGRDAIGEAIVKIESGDLIVVGRGASTDVIEASVKAYVSALNRLMYRRKRIKNHSKPG